MAETESVTVAPSMADWLAGAETITGAGVAGVPPPPEDPPPPEEPPPDDAAAIVMTNVEAGPSPVAFLAEICTGFVPETCGVPEIVLFPEL